MRVGVPYISQRYCKTNVKYLKFYEPKQESILHTLTRMSNAVFKFLSRCKFKWTEPKRFDSNKYSSNRFIGCNRLYRQQ